MVRTGRLPRQTKHHFLDIEIDPNCVENQWGPRGRIQTTVLTPLMKKTPCAAARQSAAVGRVFRMKILEDQILAAFEKPSIC